MSVHQISLWVQNKSEMLAGIVFGSIITPVVTVSYLSFALNVIQTGTLALVSGALGAIGAHLAKQLITKIKEKYGKID